MGGAARLGAERFQLVLDAAHGAAEIALAFDTAWIGGRIDMRIDQRPARREDAGPVAERLDAQAAVVGERGEAGKIGGGARLEIGIVHEGDAGLLGLGQVELGGRDRLDPVGAEQVANLAHLAFIVTGDDQPAGRELAGHRPVARSCAAKISPQPMRARRSRRSSPSSSNTSPSALTCASTIWPRPVSTKLPSDPAEESST